MSLNKDSYGAFNACYPDRQRRSPVNVTISMKFNDTLISLIFRI